MLNRLRTLRNKRIVVVVFDFVWFEVDDMSASLEALNKAIGVVGSPTELAKRVGVSPQNVFNWKKRGVPAERVPAVVRATNGAIQAHELRPDLPELFPVPTDSVAAA